MLDEYKKGVGYEKLSEDLDKAKMELELAQEKVKKITRKIHMKGLTEDGCQYSPYFGGGGMTVEDRKIKLATLKVKKLLDAVNNEGPENIRNKIIARLWCSATTGEAMVILRQVLGNGIIPSYTKEDVKLLGNDNEM